MTAIAGATHTLRVLVDGTLSISIMIEPRHAQDAFKLFGAPGTAVALAALLPDDQQPPEKEHKSGGELAKLASMWCRDADFQEWLKVGSPEEARSIILSRCGITSRRHLDHDEGAARIFHDRFRIPYRKHLVTIGKVHDDY